MNSEGILMEIKIKDNVELRVDREDNYIEPDNYNVRMGYVLSMHFKNGGEQELGSGICNIVCWDDNHLVIEDRQSYIIKIPLSEIQCLELFKTANTHYVGVVYKNLGE